MLGNFNAFVVVLRPFLKLTFFTNPSGTLSERQTVWIQIRNDVASALIWFQTVCKCYQQMIKVATICDASETEINILLVSSNKAECLSSRC